MRDVVLVGTSHHQGTLQGRVPLVAAPDTVRTWLTRTAAAQSVEEVFLLATCNRVECYAVGRDAAAIEGAIVATARDMAGTDFLGPAHPRYVKHGAQALHHLCRVTCGLDSAILGEVEILGQVRRAASAAREAGTLGPAMRLATEAAIRAGRRSHASTGISRGVTSVSAATVSLVRQSLGSLAGRSVLVVGAGRTARQILNRLQGEGVSRLLVASRSATHASEAAGASGAVRLSIEGVAGALDGVDVVVGATYALQPIVSFDMVAASRRPARQIFIDLSVPPSIDPAVAGAPGVVCYGLADVERVIRDARETRERHVPCVEAIAAREANAV